MKQLEAAAAALEPTRKVLADTQGKLRTLAQVSHPSLAYLAMLTLAVLRG